MCSSLTHSMWSVISPWGSGVQLVIRIVTQTEQPILRNKKIRYRYRYRYQ